MLDEGIFQLLEPFAEPHPVYLPETFVRPCITFRLVSETRNYTHDGASGLVQSRYQLTVHADNHPQAADLSRELRRLFNAYTGPLGRSGLYACHTQVANVFDIGFNEDVHVWQIATDVFIFWMED